MPVFNNALAGAAGSGGADGYTIERSLRFNEPDTAHLSKNISTKETTFTLSFWFKRSKLGTWQYLWSTTDGSGYSGIGLENGGDRITLYNGSHNYTSGRYRDVSAWYHAHLKVSSGAATLYINGEQVATATGFFLGGGTTKIGNFTSSSHNFNGYIADFHCVSGTALDPTSFGESDADTGVWNPIKYTGSYTTTGSTSGTLPNYNSNTSLPTYSDQDGNSGTPSVYQMENAFDGNSSTYANMTYANGKWTRANFAQPITNVTRIDIGWDGEGDVGYNGSVVNSSVGYNGSRQSLTLYNNSGSPITLNNIHMVTQAGNGVCRLYDITITTTTQSATELTFSSVPAGINGFHLPFSPDTSLTHPNKYKTQGNSGTPPSNASTLTYNTGNYFGSNQGVTYDAGSVKKFWVQPGSSDPSVKTSNDGTSWTTVFDGSVGWNDPIEVNCRYVYMSSSGNGFGPYYSQPAFAADASGNDNHWLDKNLNETITPATTSHRYWRAVIHGMYGSHWPRMSKLYFYEADGTRQTHKNFASDNCSDQGSIPSEGGVYSADYTNSYNFTNVGIYSTYNGGHRTGYADVYYSDDNNSWTYSFTSVVTNNAQCGERVGALAETDNFIDSPSNYEAENGNNGGNYCTWNPLTMSRGNMSDGNLLFYGDGTNTPRVNGTISQSSGKWYYEANVLKNGPGTGSGDAHNSIGWGLDTVTLIESAPNNSAMNHSFYLMDSGWYKNFTGSNTYSNNGTWSAGDVIGVAADLDNNTLTFYRNGTQVLSQTIGVTAGTRLCPVHQSNTGNYGRLATNFGQRPFKYPPGGTGGPAATFKSLCTQNFDAPLIENPSDYFAAVKYEGNSGDGSSTTQDIVTTFSPDLVWIKDRDDSNAHHLFDTIRGAGKRLFSNSDASETDVISTLSAFNSDGFTVNGNNAVNRNNYSFISWNWDGGNLVTNSTYDQSEVWSSFWSATGNGIEASNPAANSFDGILTGLGMRLNGSSSCTWAPTGGYSYSGDFLIYACKDNNYTGVSWTVVHAGGTTDITSSVAAGTTMTELNLTNLGVQSPITSISFTSNSNSNPRIAGMKANNKILVDAGVIPVGSLNSSVYLSDAVYSNSNNFTYTGTSGFSANSGLDKLFDGRLDTQVDQVDSWTGGQPAHLTWTPATAIPVTSSLRIYGRWYLPSHNNQYLNRDVVTINGSSTELQDTVSNTTSNHWFDLSSYIQSNNITSITEIKGISYPNGGNRLDPAFMAIEIDGKILVDSNVTPPNVPSIPSTVRANPIAGFSITKYTGNAATGGASVAHGLNQKPDLLILKSLDTGYSWTVWHKDFSATELLYLNHSFNLQTNKTDYFNSTLPTSTVFSLRESPAVNSNGDEFICYAMHAVEGYSAFGSYEGGSAPFVFTGFQPRWVMIKNMDTSGEEWTIFDTTRDTDNVAGSVLYANTSGTEFDGDTGTNDRNIDILSNGFKVNTGNPINQSATHIYLAFAQNPFKTARAR